MKNINKTWKRLISLLVVVAMVIGIVISPLGEVFNLKKTAQAESTNISGSFKLIDAWGIGWKAGIISLGSSPFGGGEVSFTSGDLNGITVRGGSNDNSAGVPYNAETGKYGGEAKPQLDRYTKGCYVDCIAHGKANPTIGWTGSYSGTKTTEISGSNEIITYNVTLTFNVAYPDSYQKLRVKWTVTQPAYGSIQLQKKYAKTTGLKNLIDKYPNAYSRKSIYTLFESTTAQTAIAVWTESGGTTTVTNVNTNPQYGKAEKDGTMTVKGLKPGTYYVEETRVDGTGYARNTGRKAVTITAGKTTTVTGDKVGDVNVDVPIIVNITGVKTDKDGKTLKKAGTKFDLYYNTNFKSSDASYYPSAYLNIQRSSDGKSTNVTGKSSDAIPSNIVLIATGVTNDNGDVIWTPKVSVSGWNFGSGTKTFNGPIGYYTMVETEAPEGYLVGTTPYSNHWFANAGGTKAWNATNDYVVNTDSTSTPFKVADPEAYSLTITKSYETPSDSTTKDLHTLFPNVYKHDGAVYSLNYGKSASNSSLIATVSIGSDGKGTFAINNNSTYGKTLTGNDTTTLSNLKIQEPDYAYYLKETRAPQGYKVNAGWSNALTVNEVGESFTSSTTDKLSDSPILGEVHLDKNANIGGVELSIADGDFDGAEFTLFYSPSFTGNTYFNNGIVIGEAEIVEDANGKQQSRTATVSTQSSGLIKRVPYKSLVYPVGTFKIENGKIKATASKFTVTTGVVSALLTLGDYKAGVATDNGNQYFTDLPLGAYCLVETKTPYDKSGRHIEYSEVDKMVFKAEIDSETNSLVVTDVTENVSHDILTNGNYNVTFNVKETGTAPVWLSITKSSANADLSNGNNGYNLTGAEYSVYWNPDTPLTTNLNGVSKDGNTREPNKGNGTYVGKFIIKKNGKGYVAENTFEGDAEVPDATTGTDVYKFYGKPGYYVVIETKLPNKGYTWGDEDIIYAAGDENKQIALDPAGRYKNAQMTDSDNCINEPIILRLTKEASSNLGTDDITEIKPVDGAEFTLKFYAGYGSWGDSGLRDGIADGSIVPTKTFVYKVIDGKIYFNNDNYVVPEKTTDEFYRDDDGEIIFPVGVFTLAETKAPDGYSINNKNWTITDRNNVTHAYAGFANNSAMVFRVKQDPDAPTKGITEIMTGSDPSWMPIHDIASDATATSVEITMKEEADYSSFEFQKNEVFTDGTEAGLGNTEFTLYYFYKTANQMIEAGTWDTFVESLSGNDPLAYASILNNADASWVVVTDADGKYDSREDAQFADHKLPTGHFVLVENNCESNSGLVLAKPEYFETTNKQHYKELTTNPLKNYVPEIKTLEWDKELSSDDYKTHMSHPDNDVKIVDEVSYTNLKPGTEYTVKAIIMDITDGAPVLLRKADKNSIQKRVKFTTASDGVMATDSVLVEFNSFSTEKMYVGNSADTAVEVDAQGRKFVIYEFLFEGDQTGTALTLDAIQILTGQKTGTVNNAVKTKDGYIGHFDMTDDDQIGYFPEVHTTERDALTLIKVSPIWNGEGFNDGDWVNVEDVLTYENLDENLTYTVLVTVRNYEDDSVVATLTDTLTPDATGTKTLDNIWFTPEDMDKFYICEDLYKGSVSTEDMTDAIKVAHHDAKIEAQTGYIARIGTTAGSSSATGESENGIITVYAAKNVTLTDTVACHNLQGLTVTMTCEYKYVDGPHAGETVKDAKGNALTKTITHTFKADEVDENVDISIPNLDLTNLKDLTIVAYETLVYKNSKGEDVEIAKEHKDDSLTQSLKVVGTPVEFIKVDNLGNTLSGAKLEVRKESTSGDLVEKWTTDGTAKQLVLEDGTYYLIETEAPKNFAVAEPVKFTVESGKIYVKDVEQDTLSITMVDTCMTALPTAGGKGTVPFTAAGLLMMLGLPVYLFIRKKRLA